MTDDLLPAELAGLPIPWNLTSYRQLQAALASRDAPEAPAVLDRVLTALPALWAGHPPDEAVPEGRSCAKGPYNGIVPYCRMNSSIPAGLDECSTNAQACATSTFASPVQGVVASFSGGILAR